METINSFFVSGDQDDFAHNWEDMEPSAKRGRPPVRGAGMGARRGRGGMIGVSGGGGDAGGAPSIGSEVPFRPPVPPTANLHPTSNATATPTPTTVPPSPSPYPPPVRTTAVFGGPSFTNDILNRLPPNRRQEMLQLVSRFRGKQMVMSEFMSQSRVLLGEKLYAVLSQGMSYVAARPSASEPDTIAPPTVATTAATTTAAAATTSSAPTTANAPEEKFDSAALQDVIQYSGVDLRAEAEMILRTATGASTLVDPSMASAIGGTGVSSGYHQLGVATARDPRLSSDYFFHPGRLRALVSAAVLPRGITDMSEDCLEMIALATHRRLATILTELVAISKARIDSDRVLFKIKIENDPRRQLWAVEEYLRTLPEQAALSGMTSPHSAGGTPNPAMLDPSSAAAAAAAAKARLQAHRKALERRVGEDVAVKTKLANVTAAAATGLQLKSWMTDPAALAAASALSSTTDLAGGGGGAPISSTSPINAKDESGTSIHFSQAPSMTPITDREMQLALANRQISIKDLIYYAENDVHLCKTTILLSLYNQLANTST